MSEQHVENHQRAVLVCADNETLRTSLAFLSPEGDGYDWLALCAGAVEARQYALRNSVEEIWVASSDEVEGINLAAALKRDRPEVSVFLAGCERTGSVLSRVHAASLDGVLSLSEVQERTAQYESAGGSSSSALKNREEGFQTGGEMAVAGFLLSVVSGSGGAGKSTVATLCAHLAARRGFRVALLDADFQFGDLREISGIAPCVAVDEILQQPGRLDDFKGSAMLLVAAPLRLEQAEVATDRLDDILDLLLDRFDAVIANTGGAWDDHRLRLLERSMTALFLVDQRVSSVRACRHALDLCLRCGVATGSFLMVANRCHKRAAFTSIDVSSALQGAHVVELVEGGADVEELLGSGLAEQLVAGGNPLCVSLDALLDEVMPARTVKPNQVKLSQPIARIGIPQRRDSQGRRLGHRTPRKRARSAAAPASEPAAARE